MKYNLTDKKLVEEGGVKDIIIEKHGYVPTFTLSQLEENIKYTEKQIKEAKAMQGLEIAKKENIEHHHPFVKELEKFERFTIHAYAEAVGMAEACQKKIDQLEAQLSEDVKELSEIKEQIPELAEIESPYVAPAEEAVPETVDETPEAPSVEDEAK